MSTPNEPVVPLPEAMPSDPQVPDLAAAPLDDQVDLTDPGFYINRGAQLA